MLDPGGYILKRKDRFLPVYLDSRGGIVAAGDLIGLGLNGSVLWELSPDLMVPLPAGADLMVMPGRYPLAMDPKSGEAMVIEGGRGKASALAAILPIGYTRLLLPAVEDDGRGPDLPLYGYTAVAQYNGRLYAAALRTDDPGPWSPASYDPREIEAAVARALRESPTNRLLAQLAFCARSYHCRTAQNLFLRRGEAGLPSAPSCNADCLGCISKQPAGCCPSPQSRIDFVPSVEEIIALAVPHLREAPGAIVSFGQGCEGEPLTVAARLAEAISAIRRRTSRGQININTNAGLTESLASLIRAGLDSLRVSLFSAIDRDYLDYHRPAGYGLQDVRASLLLAREAGCAVDLNLLVYPGYTDGVEQAEALIGFCRDTGVGRIQLRNLNLDPRRLRAFIRGGETMGLPKFIEMLRRELPGVSIGNYTKSLSDPKAQT